MTELAYIPDHLAAARDTWLSQDRDRPRLAALMAAICAQVQDLEDRLFDAWLSRPITVATGDGLDLWGELLGEPREGAADGEYRGFLQARLIVLRSTGRIDELLLVAGLISAGVATYSTAYPAGYRIAVEVGDVMSDALAARVVRTLDAMRPAGVGADVVELVTGGFRFDVTPGFDGPAWSRRL